MVVHGPEAVARQARAGLRAWIGRPATNVCPALVNGAAGVIVTLGGRPMSVMGFTIANGKIVEIDAIGDPARVRTIASGLLAGE
jgi:RNA polymerase sigma-70 factor (ECF subfamily)